VEIGNEKPDLTLIAKKISFCKTSGILIFHTILMFLEKLLSGKVVCWVKMYKKYGFQSRDPNYMSNTKHFLLKITEKNPAILHSASTYLTKMYMNLNKTTFFESTLGEKFLNSPSHVTWINFFNGQFSWCEKLISRSWRVWEK
jgi:hypothetical protein